MLKDVDGWFSNGKRRDCAKAANSGLWKGRKERQWKRLEGEQNLSVTAGCGRGTEPSEWLTVTVQHRQAQEARRHPGPSQEPEQATPQEEGLLCCGTGGALPVTCAFNVKCWNEHCMFTLLEGLMTKALGPCPGEHLCSPHRKQLSLWSFRDKQGSFWSCSIYSLKGNVSSCSGQPSLSLPRLRLPHLAPVLCSWKPSLSTAEC